MTHVVCGAHDPVGAHIARALLARGFDLLLVDLHRTRDELRRSVELALDEVAWTRCELHDAKLMDRTRCLEPGDWCGAFEGDGRPSHDRGGVSADDFWYLERHDLDERGRLSHSLDLERARDLARQAGCSRFFYVTSDDAGVERELAESCAAMGLSCIVLRLPIVVGPLATLRMARPDLQAGRLRRWLATCVERADSESTRHPEPIAVELISVDRVVNIVGEIVDSPSAPLPFYDLGGSRVVFELAGVSDTARLESSEPAPESALVRLSPNLVIGARSSRTESDQPSEPPLPVHATLACVEALHRDLCGLSTLRVFERGVGIGADDTKLATYECGAPGHEPVVLIGAFGLPVEFWAPLARRLESSFRILAWESRGLPNAAAAFEPSRTGPGAQAEDLCALLDARGVFQTDVIAWCNGAMVALEFARMYPERVRRLVLVNGGFAVDPPCGATDYERFLHGLTRSAAQSREMAQLMSELLVRNDARTEPPREPARSVYLQHLAKLPYRSGEALFRYSNAIRAFVGAKISDVSLPVDTDVLLITGGRDTMVHPDEAAFIARRIPNARVVDISDADHMGLHDSEEVIQTIAEFLARSRRGKTSRAQKTAIDATPRQS